MEIIAKVKSITNYRTNRYSVFRDAHLIDDVKQTPPTLPDVTLTFEKTGNENYIEEKEDGSCTVARLPGRTVKITFGDGDNQASAVFYTEELIECIEAVDAMARFRRNEE